MPGMLLVRFELRRKKQLNTLLKMYLVRASNRVSSLRKRLKKKECVEKIMGSFTFIINSIQG
jgi:hypothetical protein